MFCLQQFGLSLWKITGNTVEQHWGSCSCRKIVWQCTCCAFWMYMLFFVTSKCSGPNLSPVDVKDCKPLHLLLRGGLFFLSEQEVISPSLSSVTIHHHASIIAYLPKTSVFWDQKAKDLWSVHVHCSLLCSQMYVQECSYHIQQQTHSVSLNNMEPHNTSLTCALWRLTQRARHMRTV